MYNNEQDNRFISTSGKEAGQLFLGGYHAVLSFSEPAVTVGSNAFVHCISDEAGYNAENRQQLYRSIQLGGDPQGRSRTGVCFTVGNIYHTVCLYRINVKFFQQDFSRFGLQAGKIESTFAVVLDDELNGCIAEVANAVK